MPAGANHPPTLLVMKLLSSSVRATRFASLVILAAGLTASSLHAGPGVQHWQSAPRTHAPKARAAVPVAACTGCPGVKFVDALVTRPSWPNARGPLAPRIESREETCRVCAGASVAQAPDWPNGRGPLKPVAAPAATPPQPVAASGAHRRG